MAMIDQPRRFGAINWHGLWTLCLKEVLRFVEVYSQTVLGPAVTGLLFLAVFVLALGGESRLVAGIPFTQFLVPGLIVMAMAQNAFANTSSSLMVSKVQGNIVDVLMPPLGATELTIGYAVGGVVRGLICGLAVALAMWIFVPLRLEHPALALFHAVAGSLMLALCGMMAGIAAEKFDHLASVTNFVVTPLAFLSGTFYSIERLPEPFHLIALANPFFYMIDGFRYAMTGHADGSVLAGMLVLLGVNAALGLGAWWMFRSGFRLKA